MCIVSALKNHVTDVEHQIDEAIREVLLSSLVDDESVILSDLPGCLLVGDKKDCEKLFVSLTRFSTARLG